MEAVARRRIAVLSSHVHPPAETTTLPTCILVSACASDANGENEMKKGHIDCVFCKIISGEAPALKLYEDDQCLCILDSYPLCDGHSLIIIGAMCSKVPLISNAVMKATGCDSFNLLVNNGAAAGQVIYHTHIHIIPRKADDCLWTSESLRRRPLKLDQESSQLGTRIRESLVFVNDYENSKGETSSLIAN
ncbi:hypothetical protein OROHE_007291 [Orobanche hederae]